MLGQIFNQSSSQATMWATCCCQLDSHIDRGVAAGGRGKGKDSLQVFNYAYRKYFFKIHFNLLIDPLLQ